jgi:hypothetical protein
MKGKAIAIGMLAAAAAACGGSQPLTLLGGSAGGGSGGSGGSGGTGGAAATFMWEQDVNRNVDVIFMIDDSSGMPPLQEKLGATISSYFDVLKSLPGGLPNLHVGVVSSSMGAGRNPSIDHCPQGGDQGIFRTKPLGFTCGKASLNAGQNFIINVNGMTNYTGDIADVFTCISQLGDGGCGFEHQLESVLRALGADGAPAPPQNANFLRPDAYLQVVLLTDEDDCSAPPDSDLFDSTSATITDPLGPLQSYRCNEFGHLCGGKRPPRQPMGEVDLSGSCVSAEDGRLLRIADIVTALKHLKADPSKVFVAAIASPKDPYKVTVGPSQVKGDPSMWPYVEHSCTFTAQDNSVTYGDPAVRIHQWTSAFGVNGVFESLCTGTFAPALQTIAGQIGQALGGPCLPAGIDPSTCSLVENGIDGPGLVSSQPLTRCKDPSDTSPCWDVGTSTAACPQPIVFRNPGIPPGANPYTTATCAAP